MTGIDGKRMANRPTEGSGFVSAQQVASLAGVSRSAVSRTFTPGASVSVKTREKVMRAAEELGYQVNDLARGLLANQSRLVGLVVTKPEAGFRAHLVSALSRQLIRRGNIPVIVNTGQSEEDLAAAQRTLLGHRAEATIILSGSPPPTLVELARRNGQPLVVLGRSEPDADHVRIDNAAAAKQAARLFVERGFTRLGVAGSASGTPNIVMREQAFCAEAEKLGAQVRVARGSDSDYAGGVESGRGLLTGDRPPQAIFCVNDLLAFGLMDCARQEFGLAIPGDLAVIGFDDVPEASWLAYSLTTFRQDPEAMAAEAIRLLDLRQSQPHRSPATRKLTPELVMRQSFSLSGQS